jgi:hypothetical protein
LGSVRTQYKLLNPPKIYKECRQKKNLNMKRSR